MADKRTYESNTFACKTFACGSFTNNQQTHRFFNTIVGKDPGVHIIPSNYVYPVDFNSVYSFPWQEVVNSTSSVFLDGRLLTGTSDEGITIFLQKRASEEPDTANSTFNSLVTLGRSTDTDVLFGMGISSSSINISQPKAYDARLMKEPK